ncbi:hypothetical protein AVEN_71247-1 [Araneus ventricosus]|uniref:Uncharacterized protein n=1 Tax=Araneus ventricosus TaxID=182803 RepID=A0A4Y2SKL4_ARAVE|nr:hypothetical protein AVEN_71247-1 [Araneus ventricosus]
MKHRKPMILKPYYDCVADLLENDIGECTDDEQLYYSSEDRRQLNKCIFDQVDGLNDNEQQQLNFFGQCTEDLAEQAGCADDDSS